MDARQAHHLVQQIRQCAGLILGGPAGRDAGADRLDRRALEGVEFQIGQVVVGGDRLLPEEQAVFAGKARHQVLRPLQDEVPAKMGKADQRGPDRKRKG
jgi:hypothetical protein